MKMSNEKIIINELKPMSAVMRVYSGRPGCACGCRGKYYSRTMEIELLKGYTTDDDAERVRLFPMMLKRIYKKFQGAILRGEAFSYEGSENEYVAYDESENRTYTMYYVE
jgi:hypothetical protein